MTRTSLAGATMTESLTTTIAENVADREDVEATALPPLHDVIDPDALTEVFAPTNRGDSRANGYVTFRYCGYEVVVHADGRVEVGDSEE